MGEYLYKKEDFGIPKASVSIKLDENATERELLELNS